MVRLSLILILMMMMMMILRQQLNDYLTFNEMGLISCCERAHFAFGMKVGNWRPVDMSPDGVDAGILDTDEELLEAGTDMSCVLLIEFAI